jgi:alpha-beta hydrolase superfamily lysophospholipase
MKRLFAWLVGGTVLLLGLWVAGPRIAIDTRLRPITLPADLERYLAEGERRFPDLRPGTEKRIDWADDQRKAKTPVALVYLHGFSATRQETAPLSERVAQQLGANLFMTRLTGHGLSGEALAAATVNDWLNDVAEAVAIGQHLGDQVVVIAASSSAGMVLSLAGSGQLDEVAALVLLSPNFGPAAAGSDLLLWPWGEQIARLIIGPVRTWEPVNAGQGQYWTSSYPVAALLPMMGTVKLARTADLAAVRHPTLLFYAPQDSVVDPARIEAAFARLGGAPKQLVAVPETADPDGHIVAGAILSPDTTAQVAKTIVDFLRDNLHVPNP